MKTAIFFLLIFSANLLGTSANTCPIYPIPKVYEDSGQQATLSQTTVILINAKAGDAEKYAAGQLQKRIERRFNLVLPIVNHADYKKDGQFILLEKTHRENLKDDGFAIEIKTGKDSFNVLIAGTNARGVIYGQYAFFDLLSKSGDKIVFPAVRIRDWPSIPWRTRLTGANADVDTYDIYTLSRLNMVDIEYPAPKSKKTFDRERAIKNISLAHQRDMFVYGKISCAVSRSDEELSIQGFKDMLDCGVDGLWISFDDDGPGEDPKLMVGKVLELGKANNMTGRKIVSTPPFVAYGEIKNPFHKEISESVPGYNQTLWFFTRVPCTNDVAAAKDIGMKILPAWWYNWPRLPGRLLRQAYGGQSMRIGKPNYIYLPRLKQGWQKPDDSQLRQITAYTDTVGFLGSYILQYTCQIFGILAWNPQSYDWDQASTKIYTEVFGQDAAKYAKDFDDKMIELEELLLVPVFRHPNNYYWPCRLKNIADRPKAIEMLDSMQKNLDKIKSTAIEQSMCSEKTLETKFLEPMQATVDYSRAMVTLEYPEYTMQSSIYSRPTRALLGEETEYITPGQNEFAKKILELIALGRYEKAEQQMAQVRTDVLSKLPAIEKALDGLVDINSYADNWRNYVSGLEYWKKTAEKNHPAAQEKFNSLVEYDFDDLLNDQNKPASAKILAEVEPAQWLNGGFVYRGNWGLGIYKAKNGRQAAAIIFGRDRQYLCQSDDFAELYTRLTVPEHKGKIALEVFVSQRLINRNETPKRVERAGKLWINDKIVWQQELKDAKGNDWITIPLDGVKAGDNLDIKFEVVNLWEVRHCQCISLLGPIRLIEQ